MPVQRDTATLSDMEFLNAYVDYRALHPETIRTYTPEEEQLMNRTRRRVMEAMMMWQTFGGPVPKAVTPIVTSLLSLAVSSNPLVPVGGTALGAGVAALGPYLTKRHLRCYAEQYPRITLDCFVDGWKNLCLGQGDSFTVRRERMQPTLDAVPNDWRRWVGLAFIYLNTTASLRKVFSNVYIECLTASQALQKRVSAGKRMLVRKEARADQEKEMKIDGLQTAVAGQDQLVRQLTTDHAYQEQLATDAQQRIINLELESAALRKQVQELIALTQAQRADMLRLQQTIAQAVAAASDGKPLELTVLTLRTGTEAPPTRVPSVPA